MAPKDSKEDATTEPSAGSNSAATDHTEEPQSVELVNQEASMSTEIELQIIRNEIVDYTYPWQGNQVPTQKVQTILQWKIATQYYLGVAKLQKKDKNELKAIAKRWQIGTTWKFKTLTPQRQAGLYSHSMPHRNRSAQAASTGAATEHGFPTGASANSYHRRHIRIAADAAI